MELGIYFDLRNPPPWRQEWTRVYARTLELCAEFDRGGGHSVWFTEHHLYEDGYLPQPLTFASAVAARTTNVRIGTSIMIAPFRPAAQIAEEAAIVDIVSNGRLDLGLGAGNSREEYALFSVDYPHRLSALLERIRELRAIWREAEVTPPPVQDPLPIWGGVFRERGAREIGRMGERLLCADAQVVAWYLEGLVEGGHDPAQAVVAGPANVFLTDDPERDWPRVAPHVAWQRDTYNRHGARANGKIPPIDPERWRERGLSSSLTLNGFVVDTPEEAAKTILARTAGLPVSNLHIWGSVASVDEDLAEHNVELAVTRLAPLLKAAGKPATDV